VVLDWYDLVEKLPSNIFDCDDYSEEPVHNEDDSWRKKYRKNLLHKKYLDVRRGIPKEEINVVYTFMNEEFL